MPKIHCSCGSNFESESEESLHELYKLHSCPKNDDLQWHESVFSFPGALIILIISLAIMSCNALIGNVFFSN